MSLFGRRQEKSSHRTAEDRERARLEREARRAAREGRPAPAVAPPVDEPSWDGPAPVAGEPAPIADEPASHPEEPGSESVADVAAPEPVAADPAPEPVAFHPAPEPVAFDPAPEPVAPGPEPPAAEPKPVAHEPKPLSAEPEPVAHEPGLPAAEPKPVAHEPKPLSAEPEPVARTPEPAAAEPEPAAAEPEPAAVEPEPAAAAPGPAIAEPAWEPPPWEEPAPVTQNSGETMAESHTEPATGDRTATAHDAWFADEPAPEEPGQRTVEWDRVAEGPREPVAEPQADRQVRGLDTPTVEWDAEHETHDGSEAEPVREPEPVADDEPRVRRVTSVDPAAPRPPTARAATAAGAAAASAGRPPVAARPPRAVRFDDDERPVPVRRVSRRRTLPPPPPAPGDRGGGGSPRRRRLVALGIVALLLLIAAAYLVNALFQPFAGEGGGQVRVTIQQESTAGEIGNVLEREGVVDSAFWFRLRARLDGGNLKAGDYTLRRDMPYGKAITALSAGPPPPRTISITLPEGRARRETAPVVEEAGLRGSYLAASERSDGFSPRRFGAPRNLPSLEGFLFPATYELEPGASSRDLVGLQLQAFRDAIAKVDMRRARRRNLDTYDVLTIASMVEREATIPRERALVAAVIYNRLREGMPLGIDATIRFATRNWSRPLRESELAIDSPYNTRRRTGLPPGPIGSPGLASIQAAAAPANVDFLFYVVKPCGKGAHSFSATDAEFQRDVAAYNQKREELGGRSPVDC